MESFGIHRHLVILKALGDCCFLFKSLLSIFTFGEETLAQFALLPPQRIRFVMFTSPVKKRQNRLDDFDGITRMPTTQTR